MLWQAQLQGTARNRPSLRRLAGILRAGGLWEAAPELITWTNVLLHSTTGDTEDKNIIMHHILALHVGLNRYIHCKKYWSTPLFHS